MTHPTLRATETAYFDEHDKEFRRENSGQYVLIHGKNLVGYYDGEAAAIAAGIRGFGTGPFLVRVPGETEPVLRPPAYSLGLL